MTSFTEDNAAKEMTKELIVDTWMDEDDEIGIRDSHMSSFEAAAEDAVRVDGWQHFLSSYDGNSYETDSGFVYWRE